MRGFRTAGGNVAWIANENKLYKKKNYDGIKENQMKKNHH